MKRLLIEFRCSGFDGPSRIRAGRSLLQDSTTFARACLQRLCCLIAVFTVANQGVLQSVAAAPLEVKQVYVPEDKITSWFPPGTELKVLPFDGFRKLLGQTKAVGVDPLAKSVPVIVQARHSARWEEGVLRGTSVMSILSDRGEGVVPLIPWTPAIPVKTPLEYILGLSPNGEFGLQVKSGLSNVSIQWELIARPQSMGRGFTLGLPGDASSVLTIDIPKGWIPLGPESSRIGPLPVEGQADRSQWEFAGSHGLTNLILRNPKDSDSVIPGGRLWISGQTRIDCRRSENRGNDAGNWTTEWTVEAGRQSPTSLIAQLDEGLELISVSGTGVDQFRTRSTEQGKEVVVTFSNGSRPPSKVTFKGHATVPIEGMWTVPAVRPRDATWTGGITSVTMDPSRVVTECRERGGRRLPPTTVSTSESVTLSFESRSTEPVADLVIRKPKSNSICTVTGQLNLGESAPKLECRLKWTMPLGVPPELGFELPSTWIADRIQVLGSNDSLVWHSTPLPAGAVRVAVLVPSGLAGRKELTVIVGATSTVPGGRGQFDLPRIRPVYTSTADECWIARIDTPLRLDPVAADGLAWIDPYQTATFDRSTGFPDLTTAGSKRIALAWRWTKSNGSARVMRKWIDSGVITSIRTNAQVSPDGNTLILDGRILCKGAESLKSLPIWLSSTEARIDEWEFRLDQSSGSTTKLTPAPLNPTSLEESGFPSEGSGWRLPLPAGVKQEAVIRFQARLPRAQQGELPLLFVPKAHFPRAIVAVEVPRQFQAEMTTEGIRNLNSAMVELNGDRAESEPKAPGVEPRPDSPVLYSFEYSEPPAKLNMKLRQLALKPIRPVVRDALLTTIYDVKGQLLNQLRLQVQTEGTESLEFSLPEKSQLVRVEIDGVRVAPFRTEHALSLTLPPANPSRPLTIIVIDYVASLDFGISASRLQPEIPSFQIPCLSFTWSLSLPHRWRVGEIDQSLRALPQEEVGRWPLSLAVLGATWFSPRRSERSLSSDSWRWLADRVQAVQVDNLTLGECLAVWDTGTTPIVIDRVALASAGLGPRTSLAPAQAVNRGDRAIARAIRELRIRLVSLGHAFLVTTEDTDSNDPLSSRRRATLEALAWDTDLSDRYQSFGRWIGEATPRSNGLANSTIPARRPPGWSTWSCTSVEWPEARAHIEIVDSASQSLSFVLGVVVASIGCLAASRQRLQAGWLALALIVGLSTLVLLVGSGRSQPFFSGSLVASMAIVAALLVTQRSRQAAPIVIEQKSSISASRQPVHAVAMIILAGSLISTTRGADGDAGREDRSPIIALIPYKGQFDPAAKPDRVIVRLRDFERLGGPTPLVLPTTAKPESTIWANAVSHRVTRVSRQEAILETDFNLMVSAERSQSWNITVSGTRRISATVDGVETPILIQPTGERASIPIEGVGAHRLTIKRSMPLIREGRITRLLVDVDPFPSARISIDPLNDASRLESISSRGVVNRAVDGRAVGLLGPVQRMDLTWTDGSPASVGARSGLDTEGLLLWDIEPAGDRIRARFTYRGVPRLSTVRFKVDPSLIARDVVCPGFVDIRRERVAKETVWALHVDPPLSDGGKIELEFWRPAPTLDGRADGRPSGPSASPIRRSFPQLEPIGVNRFIGAIGVRRPGNWVGRLAPLLGVETLSDESFVKMWGDLPPEPLTLSGITRFLRNTPFELITGPAVERVRIKPSAVFQITDGRVDVNYEAEFSESLGHLGQATLQLPNGFQVVEVDSPGLTDWSSIAENRLQIRLDRAIPATTPRRFKIRGWVPVDEKPLDAGTRRLRLATPWIRWLDVDAEPGLFTVESATKSAIERAEGLKLVSSDESNVGSATDSRRRLLYRVEDASKVGELMWDLIPPRLTVSIDSQLVLHSEWSEWNAVLRYDVIGGPLGTILLNVPTSWASGTRIQLLGNSAQITKETRDATTYTINPDRPIWGSQSLVLRAELSAPDGTPIQFPEIAPLGRGVTDTYLNLLNLTGQPYQSYKPVGIQAIAEGDRFQRGEFNPGLKRPDLSTSFHVQKDKWSLELERARGRINTASSSPVSPGVMDMEHAITVTANGSVVGETLVNLEAGTSSFLGIQLPRGSEILRAASGQTVVGPSQVDDELWMIPIDRTLTRDVEVLWRQRPRAEDNSGDSPRAVEIEFPRTLKESASTTVRANLPDDVSGAGRLSLSRLEPLTPQACNLLKASAVARRAIARANSIDRSSLNEVEELKQLLAEHEQLLRSSTRNAGRLPANPVLPSRRDVVEQNLAAVETEREALASAMKTAGFEDLVKDVDLKPGGPEQNKPASKVVAPVSARSVRIREIGTPTFYSVVNPTNAVAGPITLTMSLANPGRTAKLLDWLNLCWFGLPLIGSILCFVPSILAKAASPMRWLILALLAGWAVWFGGLVLLTHMAVFACGFLLLKAILDRMLNAAGNSGKTVA